MAVEGPTGDERKVVTVLFADLVDSTAGADTRDPEEVRAALRPHLARMRGELERFGGTFEKFVGDAVMAVFGAPVAHEDDPERAVRAALAIRDGISGVRVAVNTGEAFVSLAATSGTSEGIATGDVVNTAFRIEEAAEPRTVLVGESTYRATHDVIEYGERRLLQAKGKTEPLPVYEALRTTAELRPAHRPPLAPLVGRKEELSLVLDTIARARRALTVQLVTLVGVPGIGKSRLVWELQRALADDPGLVTWRRGRCLPYGDGVTYWALGEMVKQQASILESDDSGTVEGKLTRAIADLVPDRGDAAWLEGHVRTLLALEPAARGASREEAFAAWRRLFEALAESGPLVLVFEDLHWADTGLLDFIDHLADWSTGHPIVLLCTARPELHERRPAWGARTNAATILLPPLSSAETGTLVGFLLQQSLVPAELQRALLARAEGNPLYAEEFVRMLVDRGLLYRNGGGWQLRPEQLPVPESVQAIIAARVDALSTEEKGVLRAASVVGRGFWPGGTAAAAGADPEHVHAALRSLERKEFVRRLGSSSVAGELQYSFHHALVRDVAYGQIPRAERSRIHRLVAEWIDALGRPEDHSETIAHHYLRALEYAEVSGEDSSGFADAARAALADAGGRALALAASDQAERYYEAALPLSRPDTVEHARLLAGLGKARAASGGGVAELEEASGRLLEAGQPRAAAEADVLSARLLLMQGRHADAAARFDRALSLVEGDEASAEKAVVLSNVAGFRMAADRGAEAIDLAREALELATRFGLVDIQVGARATIGTARVSMGDIGGVDDLEESTRIATDAGSVEAVRAYLNLGSVVANLGDVRRAAELHGLGRAAAERFGDPTRLRWFDAERLYELYWSQRWDDALGLAGEMLGQMGDGRPHVAAFDAYLVRGWIRLGGGDLAGASEDATRALELGRSFGGPQLLYPALAFSARTLVASGDRTRGEQLADELLDSWATTRETTLPSFWVAELALVLRRLGRGEEIEEAAREHVPSTRWLDAARAVASGDDAVARRIFRDIGSLADDALVAEATS
jgi:class 3 adenylate cyclase/tetratricopeptide (TPR) repeat protein